MSSPTAAPESYSFGPFRLDLSRRELLKDEETVPLTVKAFETLAVLVHQHQRVVDKEELVKAVWPDTFVSDDSLTHSISVLRRALGDDSSQPLYIATVPRKGYRFVGKVTALSETDEVETPAPTPIPAPPPAFTAAHRLGRRWPLWTGGAVAAGILLWASNVATVPRGTPPAGTIRFLQDAPDDQQLASGAAISPDGRFLAFVARQSNTGRAQLWVRPIDSPESHALAGTDGAFRPFWSPDSESLGFFAEGKLKRVGLVNQKPQTLADTGYLPSGGSWSRSGVIVFADRQSRLFKVPAAGGDKVAATSLDTRHEIAHQAPYFLPDGRHFLYYAVGTTPETTGTFATSLDSAERVRLLDQSCSAATYAEPGFLLYVRDGSVVAQRFDAARLRVTAAPQLIASTRPVPMTEVRVGVVSASATGILTFGGDATPAHLTWFARDGRRLSQLHTPTPLHNPVISPDERYVAADAADTNKSIWLVDLERGTPTRIADGILPVWGPGSKTIAFTSRGADSTLLAFRSIMGPATGDAVLVNTPEMKIGGNWTADNRYVVYTGSDPRTRLDLWRLSLADGKPVPYLQTPFNEMQGQVSPDGRWIAYASDESGSWEVYVQTFPVAGGKRTISSGGGAEPQWRRDGRELYYLAPDGTLMSVAVHSGEEFEAASPNPLFRARISSDIITYRNHYTVTADGQKFLVDEVDDREPINVVVNWSALLQ